MNKKIVKGMIKCVILDLFLVGLILSGYLFNNYKWFIEFLFYFLYGITTLALLFIPKDKFYELFFKEKELRLSLIYKIYQPITDAIYVIMFLLCGYNSLAVISFLVSVSSQLTRMSFYEMVEKKENKEKV